MEQVLIRAELFIQVGLDCGLMRHNTLKLSIVGRVDYVDEDYEKLAVKAQTLIEKDVELQKHYFQRCFTFCTDGKPDEFDEVWNQIFNKVKNEQPSSMWNELKSHEEVFHDLHGNNAWPIEESNLGRVRRWVKGYSSKRCATVNAGAMIKVYYGRCRTKSNITFILGKPVDRLWYNRNRASVKGVVLENGLPLRADSTILATGAWSSLLVRLDQQMEANAVPIAYIRLIPEEYEQYKDIACHTNLSTGFNLFTPIGGLLKILRRLAGVQNTTTLKDPDDPAKTYRVSYPKTKVDDPLQWISTEIEQSFRDELKEIFPPLADRPFENIRFCWLEQTTNGDFLICPHPKYGNLHLATGGSLHGWKFLPLLDEFVVDSLTGQLESRLVEKWSWESKVNSSMGKLGFMKPGLQQEFQELVAKRPQL